MKPKNKQQQKTEKQVSLKRFSRKRNNKQKVVGMITMESNMAYTIVAMWHKMETPYK